MRRALRLIARSTLGVFVVGATYVGVTWAQILLRAGEVSHAHADALIVFGTAENNGVPSPTLRRRLEDAAALWSAGRVEWVAVTGFKQPGDHFTEAGVEASWLEAHGVPANRVLRGAGSDTWQNVATILPALEVHHLHTVLTVTDPFHEYRAMAICAAQGLAPLPAPDHSWIVHSLAWHFYAKEALEVSLARVVGYDTISKWSTGVSILHPHANSG